MANNRTSIPSWDSIKESAGSGRKDVKSWIDTLIQEENPDVTQPGDPDFEIDSGANSTAMSATSSSNPARPRTIKAGYDRKNQILTIVFRDGLWYEYRGVPEEMWQGFQAAPSKGKYLAASGLDSWGDKGPANITTMPKHRRIQMASSKETADALYNKRKNR